MIVVSRTELENVSKVTNKAYTEGIIDTKDLTESEVRADTKAVAVLTRTEAVVNKPGLVCNETSVKTKTETLVHLTSV